MSLLTSPLGMRRRTLGDRFPLSIDWHTAFYAEDMALADGAAVSTLSDSSGNGHDAVEQSGTPATFVASSADLNGHASVQFGGWPTRMTVDFTSLTAREMFAVLVYDQINTGNNYAVEGGSGTTSRMAVVSINNGANFSCYVGATSLIVASPADLNPHAFRSAMIQDDGGVEAAMDGGTLVTGSGGNNQSRITLGNYISSASQYAAHFRLAFYGLFEGNLSSGQRDDLLAWSRDKYGTP